MRTKLTEAVMKREIARAEARSATEDAKRSSHFLWDSDCSGFGAKFYATGRAVYIVQARNRQGRSRRLTLGEFTTMSVKDARERALVALGHFREGKDPIKERKEEKEKPTVQDLCDEYMKRSGRTFKRDQRGRIERNGYGEPLTVSDEDLLATIDPTSIKRTIEADCRYIRHFVEPALGDLLVENVRRHNIESLRRYRRAGSKKATSGWTYNRVRALISVMFSLAEDLEYIPPRSNPCAGAKREPELPRERYLSGPELARLGQALRDAEEASAESCYAIAAIRLLAYTGGRSAEIIAAQWHEVDFDDATLYVPAVRNKTKKPKKIHLNAQAIAVLRSIEPSAREKKQIPWIIRGKQPEGMETCGPMTSLPRVWQRICKKARIRGARPHDLRHSYATYAVADNIGLPLVAKLLGHAQISTTARYGHAMADPVREANARTGRALEEAMASPPNLRAVS